MGFRWAYICLKPWIPFGKRRSACALAVLAFLVSLIACQSDPQRAAAKSQSVGHSSSPSLQSTSTCQAPVPRWAKRFRAECHDGLLHLTALEAWKNQGGQITYVLLPPLPPSDSSTSLRLPPLPQPRGDMVFIRRNPRRIATLVGAQIGFLDALQALHRVKAISRRAYVYAPALLAGLDAGQVHEVGEFDQASPEALASLGLDAIWHAGGSTASGARPERLHKLGIASVESGEWMESHPLGRAEWMLFYGALIDALPLADSLFRSIEQNYLQIRDTLKISAAPKRTAFSGAPWQGIWHIPGGRSYVARLMQDAGLQYLWADDTTEGSLSLSPEAVLARAQNADLWLNPGSFTHLAQASATDSRYAALRAFRAGEVYANDARALKSGASDYWETGIVRPDRLLRDLAAVTRSDTSDLTYWRRLPHRPSL